MDSLIGEIIFYVFCLLFLLLAVAGVRAAYRNGVNDGFGFSWEPDNPGYQKAGDYLTKHCSYKWRQLGNPSYVYRKPRND